MTAPAIMAGVRLVKAGPCGMFWPECVQRPTRDVSLTEALARIYESRGNTDRAAGFPAARARPRYGFLTGAGAFFVGFLSSSSCIFSDDGSSCSDLRTFPVIASTWTSSTPFLPATLMSYE